MAKILFSVFSNVADIYPNTLDAFYDNMIKGMADAGNDILVLVINNLLRLEGDVETYFNHVAKQKIKENVVRFKPDIIFSPNHDVPLCVLENTDCKVIVYTADSPVYIKNQQYIKNNIERYVFLHGGWNNVFSDTCIKLFGCKKENNHFIGHVTMVKSANVEIKRNIAFIGTIGWPQCVKETLCKLKSQDEFDILLNEYDNACKDPATWDIGFCHVLTANNRIKTLDALCDLGLNVYGIPYNIFEAVSFSYNLVKCFRFDHVLNLEQTEDILNSSKISPNLYNAQAIYGLSWRVADVMASNACLISPYRKDLDVISPYVKIPNFESPAECRDLCLKLLKNENYRKDVVCGCHEAVDKLLCFNIFLKKIASSSGVNLIENKPKQIVRYVDYGAGFLSTRKYSLKNKLCYKVWKHLGKKLKKKGIIS